jgi:hypothetical protein
MGDGWFSQVPLFSEGVFSAGEQHRNVLASCLLREQLSDIATRTNISLRFHQSSAYPYKN